MTNTEQLYPLPVRLTATLLLAGLLFAACEESVTDTSIVLPYVEEIVVQGFLTAGATEGDTLFITRTLPPLERWTIERAAVSEAEVFVTVDGRRQEMRHIGNGLWIPDSWNVESGRQYNLVVRSGNLEVRSTTLVPADRIVDRTFRLDTVDGNGEGKEPWEIDFTCIEGVVSLVMSEEESSLFELAFAVAEKFYDPTTGDSTPYRIGFQNIWNRQWESSHLDGRFTLHCFAPGESFERNIDTLFLQYIRHDEPYREYRRALDEGDDDFFGPTLGDRQWNVTGDGFGWFFGRTVIRDTIAGL